MLDYNNMTPPDVQAVAQAISHARLGSYKRYFQAADDLEALGLYQWNEDLREAFARTTDLIEVVLRNQFHAALSQRYGQQGGAGSRDWYSHLNLPQKSSDKVLEITHVYRGGTWRPRNAPIVSTMYLDKPLKEHTLLQAIARVNRTLTGKNAGYIVDYHGVVEHLDHALKIYGGEVQPSQVWQGVESELPKLQSTLERILKLLPKKHDPVTQREGYKDDAERFLDPAYRLDAVEDFLELVKQFNRSIDIILPDVRGVPFKPYFTLFGEIRLMLRDKLPDATYRERITQLESALLQRLLDEYIAASPARSLLGREVSILDASDMARLKHLASPGSQALVMKNQLKHTIATGRDKDPAFFDKLAEELEKLLEEEKAGRISQAQFLEQLELFGQRVMDKDKTTGFDKPAEAATYHYLAALLGDETARVATSKLFDDKELSHTLAANNWKHMLDLHPEVRDLLRRLLTPLAGWERPVAREHAARILDILLKN